MLKNKTFVTVASLGLLLAVALSPALLQDTCEVPDPTALNSLEFRPFETGSELPEDAIAFERGVTDYAVELPAQVDEVMVVAEPVMSTSELSIQCISGGTIDGHMFEPDLNWTTIALPEGDSVVQVVVRASPEMGGGIGVYTINVTRERPDPTMLVNLEFRPFQMGREIPHDMMTFESGITYYAVQIPDSVTEAMVVTERAVESSELSIQCIAGGTIDGHQFDPDLSWTMIDVPEGNSLVQVVVRATPEEGGGIGVYTIRITRIPGMS